MPMKITVPGATVHTDGFYGNCPVQGHGTIGVHDDTRNWYFRARGTHWSLTVVQGDDVYVSEDDADLYVEGPADEGGEFAAGWMSPEEAQRHTTDALAAWVGGRRGRTPTP